MPSRPFIPNVNAASVELIYQYGSVVCENVIHIKKGSPYTLAELQAVRTVVINWWNATYKANIHTNVSLVRVRTKALDTNTSPMEDYTLPAASPGSVGGTGTTNAVSFCVKLASGLSGRSNRGRWYVAGLPNSATASTTQVSAAYAAAIVAALGTLKANLLANGDTLVISSYRHNKAWRAAANNEDVISIVAVDLTIDTQRRRLR